MKFKTDSFKTQRTQLELSIYSLGKGLKPVYKKVPKQFQGPSSTGFHQSELNQDLII